MSVAGSVGGSEPVGKGGPGKVTKCRCGNDGSHYSEVVMEATFLGTPEDIYNLVFTSGFMKDFMREEQKLLGECP